MQLQAFSYRGPGDPSQDALHYVVQSSAAKQHSQSCSIPSLPSGSLITGLAAAAVQYSEVAPISSALLSNKSLGTLADLMHMYTYIYTGGPTM